MISFYNNTREDGNLAYTERLVNLFFTGVESPLERKSRKIREEKTAKQENIRAMGTLWLKTGG